MVSADIFEDIGENTAITTILAIFLRSAVDEVAVSATKSGTAPNGLTIAHRAINGTVQKQCVLGASRRAYANRKTAIN